MKTVVMVLLIVWSITMLVTGGNYWLITMNSSVSGSGFAMQIAMLNCLAAMMIWLALFAIWSILQSKEDYEDEDEGEEKA